MINLLDEAGNATWTRYSIDVNGARVNSERLNYGGDTRDAAGFVNLWQQAKNFADERADFLVMGVERTESRTRYFTRPAIRGMYRNLELAENTVLECRADFLDDGNSNVGAVFEVWVHYIVRLRFLRVRRTVRVYSEYRTSASASDRVSTIDLSVFDGETVSIEIRVEAPFGNKDIGRACWRDLRVDSGTVRQPGQFFALHPQNLTVVDRNERKGGGDDILMGCISFTVQPGIRGTVSTWTDSSLHDLGEDIGTNETVDLTLVRAPLVRELATPGNAFGLHGVIYIAIEEDHFGDDEARKKIAETAQNIDMWLDRFIDEDLANVAAEGFARNLGRAARGDDVTPTTPAPPPSENQGDGGWAGHDPIGQHTIIFIPLADSLDVAPDPEVTLTTVIPQNIPMTFRGEGAVWTMNVAVEIREGLGTVNRPAAKLPVESRADLDAILQGRFRVLWG